MAKKLRMSGLMADNEQRFKLSASELPEIKTWEVGKSYDIVLKVTMKARKEGQEYEFENATNKQKDVIATFKIDSVGIEEPEPMTYSQEAAMHVDNEMKAKSGKY